MADREDFATAVGGLIKGRSPVGHTHERLDLGGTVFKLNPAGGFEHHADGGRRWLVDATGTLIEGTVPPARVSGLTAALYDSGPRDITSLASGITAGTILFHVSSGVAQMILADARFSTSAPSPFASGGALAPWAPTTPGIDVRGWALNEQTGLMYRFDVARSGATYIRRAPADTALQGVVMWLSSRPIPANPIGDPA